MKGTDLKIIRLLAKEAEYRQYEMPQVLGTSYRTVMRRLRALEDSGYVEVARRERSKKKGKKRKIYILTFKGVITHLASISLKPISLVVVGGKDREDIVRIYQDDRARYINEASQVIKFLEFYGKQLDYVIFEKINWLASRFPGRTEFSILRVILEVAKMASSYFSSQGLSKYCKRLMSDKSRLKKELRLLKKNPSLRRMTLFEGFGRSRRKREINLYQEAEARFQQVERVLNTSRELENKTWKLWFAERFFEQIADLPARGSIHDEDLHNFANELLERKKTREISKLAKVVSLFSGAI